MDFLRKDDRCKNSSTEEIVIYRTFSDILKRIVQETEDDIEKNEKIATESTVTKWLKENIEQNIEAFTKEDETLPDLDFQHFKETYHAIIKEIEEELISFELSESLDEKLLKLAYEAAKNNHFSIGSTGFVIAGFGEDDLFPHLLNYRLEGFILGRLKYVKLLEKEISYTNQQKNGTASIVPFAQKEMIDSFMGGIEPPMQEAIFDIVEEVLMEYPSQIEKHVGISFSDKNVTNMKKLGKDVYQSIKEAVYEYQQNHYIEPLLGIVRSLPKEDLADMAESLINLTSFKRRVSRSTESVGPPVDVALITKGDGFVWWKRKSFINSEINDRL